jgi:hypothetical protein
VLRKEEIAENGNAQINSDHLQVSIGEDAIYSLFSWFFKMTDQREDILMVKKGVEYP